MVQNRNRKETQIKTSSFSKTQMIWNFMLSPVFCFHLDFASYLAFLGLFAYVILGLLSNSCVCSLSPSFIWVRREFETWRSQDLHSYNNVGIYIGHLVDWHTSGTNKKVPCFTGQIFWRETLARFERQMELYLFSIVDDIYRRSSTSSCFYIGLSR